MITYSANLLTNVITRASSTNITAEKFNYFDQLERYNSVAGDEVGFNAAFGVFDFSFKPMPDFEKYFHFKVFG